MCNILLTVIVSEPVGCNDELLLMSNKIVNVICDLKRRRYSSFTTTFDVKIVVSYIYMSVYIWKATSNLLLSFIIFDCRQISSLAEL